MEGRKGPALLARKENVLGAVFPVTFLFYFFSLAWVISPLPKFSTPFDHVWDRLQNYVPPCRSDGHVHLQILFLKWPWTSPPSSRSVNESAKTRASFASLSRFKSRQVTAWDKVSPIRGLLFQLVEHDLLNGLVKLSSPSPDPVNCMGSRSATCVTMTFAEVLSCLLSTSFLSSILNLLDGKSGHVIAWWAPAKLAGPALKPPASFEVGLHHLLHAVLFGKHRHIEPKAVLPRKVRSDGRGVPRPSGLVAT